MHSGEAGDNLLTTHCVSRSAARISLFTKGDAKTNHTLHRMGIWRKRGAALSAPVAESVATDHTRHCPRVPLSQSAPANETESEDFLAKILHMSVVGEASCRLG